VFMGGRSESVMRSLGLRFAFERTGMSSGRRARSARGRFERGI
jgi:hypothetical protein